MTVENSPLPDQAEKARMAFRWSYVAMPLALALASIIYAALIYARLPAQLAWRFDASGLPYTTAAKSTFVAFMLAIQVGIAASAWLITVIFLKIASLMSRNSVIPLNFSGFIFLLSNMLLLPQIIMGYLMFDAFHYGLYGTHLLSFSVFSIWTAIIGLVCLVILFARLIAQLRMAADKK